MSLPKVPHKTKEVPLGDDALVTIRSLSRSEALAISAFQPKEGEEPSPENVRDFEVHLISTSLGVPKTEAETWRDETDSEVVETLVKEITGLSGLAKNVIGPDGKEKVDNPQPATSVSL